MVLVALSGGVDSAVAALSLKEQGEDVACIYMRTWMNEEGKDPFARCPWEEDRDSAKAVADHLGLPFEVINMIDVYRERVVKYLVEGYQKGYTPNPDIMCNKEVKFGVLLDYAMQKGYKALATGHYCQKKARPDGSFDLLEGADKAKDQSYFLSMISQAALEKVRFPIGHLTKAQVREKAKAAGLPNADRKDSQGICFLGDVKIQDFLRHYISDKPGEIVNLEGKVLGKHQGLHRYTIGQRKGIGVPSNTDFENFVVIRKVVAENRLVVAFDKGETPGLYQEKAVIGSLHWINKPIEEARPLLARPRYRDPAFTANFAPLEGERALVAFEKPQRALAAGQIMALYDGEICLGGGVILGEGY